MTAISRTLARAQVGTSGFSYSTWRPGFYPAEARPRDFLGVYSGRLPSVELNTTFYQLPSEAQLAAWAAETPESFRFSVKMSRRITHFGRLELIGAFCERLRALGDRLGAVLVQFPPTRPRDDGLLRFVLGSLEPGRRYAFEFRHESWAGVDGLLAEAGAVRVGALEAEAPFRYFRLREPPYGDAALAEWAGRIAPLLAGGVEVYCYFKHEDEPEAPHYAARLLELLAA